MNSAIASIALFILYLLVKLIKFCGRQLHMRKAVSGVPGPKADFLVGNTLQIPRDPADLAEYLCSLGKEWRAKGRNCIPFWNFTQLKVIPITGEAARVSPTQDILESEEITKSSGYDILRSWLGSGLLVSTGEKWKQHRRMLAPTFHYQMLDGYVSSMNRESKVLTELLQHFADTDEKISQWVFTLGVRGKKNIHMPWQFSKWDILTTFMASGHGCGSSFIYDRKVISERSKLFEKQSSEEDIKPRLAFLDMLLAMKNENALSDLDINDEVDTFMYAGKIHWEFLQVRLMTVPLLGHDTTSSGLCWIIWALATHPEIQKTVADELFTIFGDSDREVTIDDMKKMVYLERVIKESMRVNPPVPVVGRRLENEMKIGDVTAPAGTQVVIPSIIIHRNEQVYPEPEKFDPDRFLPENMAKRNTFDYIPFSSGHRNCIGQKFAMYEEKLMIAWLIRKFEISTDRKFEGNKRAIEVILKPHDGIKVTLRSRTYPTVL